MTLVEQEVMFAGEGTIKSATVPAEHGRCVGFDDRDELDASNLRMECFALL